MKHLTRILVVALAMAACSSDGTDEGDDTGRDPGDLTFLRLPATAPELCADSVGAWFVKRSTGGPQEIALEFPEEGDCNGGETEDFLRLRLDRNSLSMRPDSTPINVGDSIFISVKWVGNDSILFEMKPAGLRFASNAKARLKIEYGELNGDLDDDGNQDEDDEDIEQRIDIWRQEAPGLPFFRVGTGKIEDNDEIEADLSGFTRFAIAY